MEAAYRTMMRPDKRRTCQAAKEAASLSRPGLLWLIACSTSISAEDPGTLNASVNWLELCHVDFNCDRTHDEVDRDDES